jgi:hypothetical protein
MPHTPGHPRSASVGGALFVPTARLFPGRESGPGGDTGLPKGAMSADVHVQQRGHSRLHDTRAVRPPMTHRGQRDHRAGHSHGAHSPKGGQEAHRACGQHDPRMPYGGCTQEPKCVRKATGKEGENQARTIADRGLLTPPAYAQHGRFSAVTRGASRWKDRRDGRHAWRCAVSCASGRARQSCRR